MRAVAAAVTAPRSAEDAPVVSVETAATAWTAYLRGRSDTTAYHDWAWRDVFKHVFGYESIYLAARRHDTVVGVLPTVLFDSWLFGRALISLPFVNYGGVLADDAAAERALLEACLEVARGRRCRHVELRHVRQHFDHLPNRRHKVAMVLPLAPAAAMWNQLDRKARNQVRKAQKSGLTFRSGGRELVEMFYAVFARNMRDLGTPVYSIRLFDEVLATFAGRAQLHIVSSGQVPVAAGLTFQTGPVMEIPWASSVRDYNSMCPNHLLYWSLLEAAARRGCEVFDFGRSTPDEGTYRFKEQWGAQPVPLCWEYALLTGGQLPDTGPTNPRFQAAISVWKKLPVAVATRLGPRIVRSIP